MGSAERHRVHYFGDVAATGDTAATTSARLIGSLVRRTDPLERDVSQFALLSKVVAAKYRRIRRGMVCSALFFVFTSLGVLVGSIG